MSNDIDPDAWMGTLSDLIFLLITFFVLLITMASMDAKKIKNAFGLLNDASSVLDFPSSSGSSQFFPSLNPLISLNRPKPEGESPDPPEEQNRIHRAYLKAVAESISNPDDKGLHGTLRSLAQAAGGEIQIELTEDGWALILPARILFAKGTTDLGEDGKLLLREIATIIKLWGGNIDVVASWTWHEGASVMASIIEELERNWVDGRLVTPELYPNAERTIRFVLREDLEGIEE